MPVAAQPNVTNGVITNDEPLSSEGQGSRSSTMAVGRRVSRRVRVTRAPLASRYLMFGARALVGAEGKNRSS